MTPSTAADGCRHAMPSSSQLLSLGHCWKSVPMDNHLRFSLSKWILWKSWGDGPFYRYPNYPNSWYHCCSLHCGTCSGKNLLDMKMSPRYKTLRRENLPLARCRAACQETDRFRLLLLATLCGQRDFKMDEKTKVSFGLITTTTQFLPENLRVHWQTHGALGNRLWLPDRMFQHVPVKDRYQKHPKPTKPLSCGRGSCCAAVLKSTGSAMTHCCWDSLCVYLPIYIHVNIYLSRIPCTHLYITYVEHQSEYDRHHIFLYVQKYISM